MSLFHFLKLRNPEPPSEPVGVLSASDEIRSVPHEFFQHRGFMLVSRNAKSVHDAAEDYRRLWDLRCKKSQLEAPVSEICNVYNGHECLAIFPSGSRDSGLLNLEEGLVQEEFESLLITTYPEVQWVHFSFTEESASILGHTGVR